MINLVIFVRLGFVKDDTQENIGMYIRVAIDFLDSGTGIHQYF